MHHSLVTLCAVANSTVVQAHSHYLRCSLYQPTGCLPTLLPPIHWQYSRAIYHFPITGFSPPLPWKHSPWIYTYLAWYGSQDIQISCFVFWIACHIAHLLEYAIITKRFSSLSLSLSLSGAFSSFGGSWHGDGYRESGRRGFGLGSNGAIPEDVEASHSEIFIQVWCHQCIYIFFYTCTCMFCSQELLWAWYNLPACTCAPIYIIHCTCTVFL